MTYIAILRNIIQSIACGNAWTWLGNTIIILTFYDKADEWYIEWQLVATSGTINDNEWQRVTTNGKERQRVVQRVTPNDSEWPFRLIFDLFQIREEPTTKYLMENSLNLEEDLWRRPIELRAETSTRDEIFTVRSRNCRSSCSQISIKISVLKDFAIFTGNTCVGVPF